MGKSLLCALCVALGVLAGHDSASGQEPKQLPAVRPPVAVQPPQAQLREQILPYAVHLTRPLTRPETFGDGGSMWSGRCDGRICTVFAPRTARAGDVCRIVPARFGGVAGVTRGAEVMAARELKACNEARLPAVRPSEAGPQPEPPTRPGVLPGPERKGPDLKESAPPEDRVPISGGRLADVDRIRSVPREIGPETPEIRLAELAIVDVRRFAGAETVIELGEVVPVEVVVRNTGGGSATVRAATPADPRRDGGIMRYGPTRVIGPGATANLPLELPPNRIRGGRYETTVFLYKAPGPSGDDVIRDRFRDGDDADNEYRVSFEFDSPRRFDVVSTLEQLEVLDDCDNVSPGDWFVHYTIAEVRGDVVVQRQETYWPDRNNPTDVSSGSTRRLDRLLRLTSVDPESRLLIAVSAVDCDADTPFSWGITLPHASLAHALGVDLGTGPWTVASADCGGEEVWEASGTADNVGTQTYIVEAEEWQTGFVGRYRRDFQSADCDPHPFTPTVRVEASLR